MKGKAAACMLALCLALSACASGRENMPPETALPVGRTEEIVIRPGLWQLTGTLTLPEGEGPFPLVVFVHGSGPMDRDETVGKVKVFRDLAAGLAEQGIASIRYDKRTYLYGTEMASDVGLTVWEETVEDALYAVEYARAAAHIDRENIFVAGHSLGGYLVPRLDGADAEGHIAGYVLLAGPARALPELVLEQVDYLLSLELRLSEIDKVIYRQQYEEDCARIDALTEADRGGDTALLGAYPDYWLDLAGYDPAEAAKEIKKPLLILQGGHDYQVTSADYERWQTALAGREGAVFKWYPKLTHAFTETEGMGTPDDYQRAATVAPAVAEDMAAFIKDRLR